jgi:hypothetical protein
MPFVSHTRTRPNRKGIYKFQKRYDAMLSLFERFVIVVTVVVTIVDVAGFYEVSMERELVLSALE